MEKFKWIHTTAFLVVCGKIKEINDDLITFEIKPF